MYVLRVYEKWVTDPLELEPEGCELPGGFWDLNLGPLRAVCALNQGGF